MLFTLNPTEISVYDVIVKKEALIPGKEFHLWWANESFFYCQYTRYAGQIKKGDAGVRQYTGVPSRAADAGDNHAISTGQSHRGNAASMLTGHPSRTADAADSLTPSVVHPLSFSMI
ncbi:hypothetical protein TAMA11512_19110 [Selenomonas sp. TAMA-11512]|uniref:hypothetical protein n=1 Tax=Selenomonas sp. TAMA-11512 TaxID=3095337 RepID=UPI00308B689E|nr:hypothetical protein TAMA11512_19110 [Selenomonas sp. TAMA-11512]